MEAENGIITAMRFLRIVLTLVFGLAMAGPEAHACPVHSAPAHHQDGSGHHKGSHCTCPQACCPASVSVSIPTPISTWAATSAPVVTVELEASRPYSLPARKRLLPFALAPPQLVS
jgi:hypothetical protein